MSSVSQAMLNQGLFEDQEMSTQMGFFPFAPNMSSIPPIPAGCHQFLKTLTAIPPSSHDAAVDHHHHHAPSNIPTDHFLLSSASAPSKQREDITSHLGGPQLSLQRSSPDLWTWGDVNECMSNKRSTASGDQDHLGVSAMKMKKIKVRRKVREPRFCFKTMSDVDVLDDGYKWRKYGQKAIKKATLNFP